MNPDMEDMEELSYYLNKIKTVDKIRIRSEAALISRIWGILMIFAGFMDLQVAFFAGYSPHFLVWVFAVAAGITIQKLITAEPLFYDELVPDSSERQVVRWYEIVGMTIMFLGTLVVSAISYHYVLPYVLIVIGSIQSTISTFGIKDTRSKTIRRIKNFSKFLVMAIFLLLIGLISNDLYKFHGILFGIFLGCNSFYDAYRISQLTQKKSDELLGEQEIRENIDEN